MAKKKALQKTTPQKKPVQKSETSQEEIGVPKQTAGAVTGAVVGGVVAGPLGALAGGAVGAMVGDASAKGKKPLKRAADAIREEITSGHAKEVVKKIGKKLSSLRPKFKGKKSATAKKKVSTAKTAAKKTAKKKKASPAKRAKKKR